VTGIGEQAEIRATESYELIWDMVIWSVSTARTDKQNIGDKEYKKGQTETTFNFRRDFTPR